MNRALVLVLLLASWHAYADVYVWTDESGRRQISDVVPAKYRAKAKKVDVPYMPAPAEEAGPAASGGTAAPAEQEAAAPPPAFLPTPTEDAEQSGISDR